VAASAGPRRVQCLLLIPELTRELAKALGKHPNSSIYFQTARTLMNRAEQPTSALCHKTLSTASAPASQSESSGRGMLPKPIREPENRTDDHRDVLEDPSRQIGDSARCVPQSEAAVQQRLGT
jgi:hypothetical protein